MPDRSQKHVEDWRSEQRCERSKSSELKHRSRVNNAAWSQRVRSRPPTPLPPNPSRANLRDDPLTPIRIMPRQNSSTSWHRHDDTLTEGSASRVLRSKVNPVPVGIPKAVLIDSDRQGIILAVRNNTKANRHLSADGVKHRKMRRSAHSVEFEDTVICRDFVKARHVDDVAHWTLLEPLKLENWHATPEGFV